jgi:mono/diheme cytochrome c family protein
MAHSGRSLKLAAVLAVSAFAAGCASSGGPAAAGGVAAAPTPEMIAQGQSVYSGSGGCQTCHGAGGVGGRFGPNLADRSWLWFDNNSPTLMAEIAELVRRGVPQPRGGDTPMPAMGGRQLSDDQIMAVAAYLVSLNR